MGSNPPSRRVQVKVGKSRKVTVQDNSVQARVDDAITFRLLHRQARLDAAAHAFCDIVGTAVAPARKTWPMTTTWTSCTARTQMCALHYSFTFVLLWKIVTLCA